MKISHILAGALVLSFTTYAQASPFTETSPTAGGAVVPGVTDIGGIVVDLIGTNGNRVMSQLSASSLFEGFAGTNPFTIGSQSGFDSSVMGALGTGIVEASFRFTLFDGDSAAGNFDQLQENNLTVNGVQMGYWGETPTVHTDSSGTVLDGGVITNGFSNNQLDTGWFYSNNSTALGNLYTDLQSTQTLTFELFDVDPGDNYFDFTQGIDADLINVGSGPGVTPPGVSAVPEPSIYALMLGGLGLVGFMASRRRKQAQV